jgi:FMN phosphatase YigB (HAD superfamily)
MGEIHGIFFWLTGVYTQPFQTLIAQALIQTKRMAVNPLALPNFAVQVEGLATGKIDGLAFCRELNGSAGIKGDPAALREQILDGITPNPGVVEATRLLPEHIQRWLVVDLPIDWFEKIAGQLELLTCFVPEQIIFLPTSKLQRLIPDAFYHLAYRAQLPMQECLLIDASARRAVQALKHGLSTEIFVDTRRLERTFVMREFIDRPHPVHKPNTSL